MTGFGYVNTTGLKAMDYFLTDSHQTPPGVEHLYVETLARLPNDYICYKPPDYLPEVSALPAALNGDLTLGCFNKLAKLTPETLALWSKLLAALPNARLLLKTSGLEHPERVEYLKRDIHKAGIDFSRVDISGGAPHEEFLKGYHAVDIALDPIPYSGGLTTCEALWMGVPVVTLRGERFASLHSTSHLSNADLVDWITESEEEYIQLVVQWSQKLQELQSLREGMRARLQKSLLSNGPQYTADFESLLKLSFKTYCDGSSQ
jgi:predicted O-linked N-acetylglucosamine transferase (SPINDLY family)